MGSMYALGGIIERDFGKAIKFNQKARDLSVGAGCYGLGMMCELGNSVKKDFEQALQLFQKACDFDGLTCVFWVKDILKETMRSSKILPKP